MGAPVLKFRGFKQNIKGVRVPLGWGRGVLFFCVVGGGACAKCTQKAVTLWGFCEIMGANANKGLHNAKGAAEAA